MLFLLSPNDKEELAAVRAVGAWHVIVPWKTGPGDYAKKINFGVRMTTSDWLFTGADDLKFHPGWLRACLNLHIKSGALVIGTNDLMNPSVVRGMAATHSLVHRSYVERAVIDSPGDLLCEEYFHNCVDSELVDFARRNQTFAAARTAHVEHLHPTWKRAPDDPVYRKGRLHHGRDRKLFARRRQLWGRLTVAHHTIAVNADGTPRAVGRWPRR